MRIGCCTKLENYRIVKQIGYDFIELSGIEISALSDSEFEDFVNVYDIDYLPCQGFNAFTNAANPIVGPNVSMENLQLYMEKLCSRGGRLGIKSIGIGAPYARKLPSDFDYNIANRQMKEFLKMSCSIAEKYNISLLLESLHKHMCNYMNTVKEAYDMVKELNLANLRIVLDFYHMKVMEEDLFNISYAVDMVEHLHVSHINRKNLLINNGRDYLTEKDLVWLRPIIKNVQNYGYDKTISIESDTSNFYMDAEETLKVLKKAIEAGQ